jgi:hypothetical protein
MRMPKFRELLLQLRERSLWQILGSYVVASWVALQVLDTVSALLGLPLWFTRPVLILLIIGFFVLLLTGVVQRTWTNLEARADSRPERTRLGRLLTWRKATLAGVTAFALLGVFTAVWLAMRTFAHFGDRAGRLSHRPRRPGRAGNGRGSVGPNGEGAGRRSAC